MGKITIKQFQQYSCMEVVQYSVFWKKVLWSRCAIAHFNDLNYFLLFCIIVLDINVYDVLSEKQNSTVLFIL